MLCYLFKSPGKHLLLPDLAYACPARLAVAPEGMCIPDALPLYAIALRHPELDFLPSRIDLPLDAFRELFLEDREVVCKRGRREAELGV